MGCLPIPLDSKAKTVPVLSPFTDYSPGNYVSFRICRSGISLGYPKKDYYLFKDSPPTRSGKPSLVGNDPESYFFYKESTVSGSHVQIHHR
jgi:hypothetical protein